MPADANPGPPLPVDANPGPPLPVDANPGPPLPVDANPGPPMPVDANPGPPMPVDADPGPPMPVDANPGPPDAGPPNGLSDEFDGASLDPSWNIKDEGLFDEVTVTDGELQVVVSRAETLWYHADHGPALWKSIAGNFKATTSVYTHREGYPDLDPGGYQFGGLIAYDPAISPLNYVFGVVGPRDGMQLEFKTTVDSYSEVAAEGWGGAEAELRICRVGDRFNLYARARGSSSWGTPAVSYERPDLPNTLKVGPFAYSLYGFQTMRAHFSHFYIEEVASEADCTTD
ncbi:MAG: hypothetical protein Tsb0020_36620 [Haliangiales bacterium]